MNPPETPAGQKPATGAPASRFGLQYLALVGAPAALIAAVLAAGASLAPAPTVAPILQPATAPGAAGSLPSLLLLLLQIGIILLAARLVGRLLGWMGQPQVIGEMVAGLLLGPSVLEAAFPDFSRALFPTGSLGFLSAISQVGIVLYLFLVGLELDPAILKERRRTAILTSHASISAPFLLGCLLALALYPSLAGNGVGFVNFALFLGGAMSITAFPVLARILAERRLLDTRLGAIALTCAAVDDVSAWCILAAVAGLMRTAQGGQALWVTAIGLAAFTAFTLTIGRHLLGKLAARFERQGEAGGDALAGILIAALAGAAITEWLGVHALFGAFLVGAAMPGHGPQLRAFTDRLEKLLAALFLPLFFAFTGLRTQVGLLNSLELWLLCGAVIAVAIAGKLGGSTVAARLGGLSWRESAAIGVLMNTRGLIELVFLNVGLELGVITPALFAMMVLMALVTTFMTSPILAVIWRTPSGGGDPPPRTMLLPRSGPPPDPAAGPRVDNSGELFLA